MRDNHGAGTKTVERIFLVVLFVTLLFYSSFSSAAVIKGEEEYIPAEEVSVLLNGSPLQFDVPPHYRKDELMVPVRKIFEEMGYRVYWEAEDRRVVLYDGQELVVLYPDNHLYALDGSVYRSFLAPYIVQGRTMVGLDFLQQASAAEELSWQEESGVLQLKGSLAEGEDYPVEPPPLRLPEGYRAFLVEILPSEDKVAVGDPFQIAVGAPGAKGIFSYEIVFDYDPRLLEVEEVHNPVFDPSAELYIKEIDNRQGRTRYTQATLGYRKTVSPRDQLTVFEVRVQGEGTLQLEELLEVTLVDNTAGSIPLLLEKREVLLGGD